MKTASKLVAAGAASVVLAAVAVPSGTATAGPDRSAQVSASKASKASKGAVTPRDPLARRFVRGVSLEEITEHQIALQRIASLNDDTREVFSPGYQESLEYVVSTLRDAGLRVRVDRFNYPVWEESRPPVLNQVSPTPKAYVPGDAEDDDQPTVDFIAMANSPTVELTNAPVFPVGGILDPPTGGSTSGCAAADYAGVAGKVALVQRGTCAFVDKWELAQAAGATGVIIYNEGNTPERQNPIFVDNQPDTPATIAAVISSYTVGNELLQAYEAGQNPTVDLKVYGTFTDRFLPQVIAETRGGDPDHVVVVGAHLDSVPAGPGINDDGSGVATLLAQAEELAEGRHRLRNKIRFAFWGAEENGLVGSVYYALNLSDREVDRIDVMLDYDMLASANYVRFVYDGDGNAAPDNPAGPEGSGKVEQVHDDWFRSRGLTSERTPFDGRSDYVGFTLRGIPAGGVFAGAEGVKTPEQAAEYGGAAGSWYDPCYHQLCDNLSTVLTGVPPLDAEGLAPEGDAAAKRAAQRAMAGRALTGLDEMSDAASYAVYYFGASKDPFGTRGHRPDKAQGKAQSRAETGHSYPWRGHHRNRR
ncbi:M20/M25/M40 family metallo-hydrolase [Nocardioides sp. 616]|uniref:M28 family metallopeptidase n=1 Tax=Nocardioides sp. 616 TaxID=2268090 RepID=UPI000CE564AA|nr:M20/M25/M40 family metallo-hydrolase [Nocardioides sp. 616]